MTQTNWLARLAPLLPAGVAVLLFLPCLNFEFIWDDSSFLVQQHALSDWPAAWRAAFSAYLQGSLVYFRPLPILTLAFDLLPNGGAHAAHRTNMILHAANSGLVAYLAAMVSAHLGRTARQATAASLLAGILYAAHPALIQSAAWISCRFDLMVTGLGLLFLIADRKLAQARARPWLLALIFFLAALSKENAVVLPLLLPFWRRLFGPAGARLRDGVALMEFVLLFAAGVAYLGLRHYMLIDVETLHIPLLSPPQQLLLVLKSIGGYLWLTLLPLMLLNPIHPMPGALTLLDGQVITGIAAVCALLQVLRSPRPLAQLAACYALSLLPVINLVRFNLTDYMQERFLTLPLAFACVLVAQVLVAQHASASPQSARRITVLFLPGAWLLMCGLALHNYLPVWHSNLDLWSYALAHEPASPKAQKFMLVSLNALGRSADAVTVGRRLEQIYPDSLSVEVRYLYERALSAEGMHAPALDQLERIAADPGSSTRVGGLCAESGWVELARGQPVRAAAMLRTALHARPENAEATFHLGIALQVLGSETQGAGLIAQAVRMEPESAADWQARSAQLVADAKTLAAQAEGAPTPHAALDHLCVATPP